MPYKPIISKIRCHNPNLKSAKHANRANLHYIATREGVDQSEVSEEQQDNRMYKHASDEDYTRYIAKRPRSHGLFGNIETDDLKSVEQLVYKTSQNGKNIYRGIISLGEQDAQELGYVNSAAWYQQLKAVMPDIAKELGISPTNFTWIGAFHAEPSHPHVHYLIWDNTEKIRSSFLHVSTQKQCRAVIEKAMFPEEYEKSLQAVFESEREELYSIKNASREKIMDYFKNVMSMEHVPGIQHTDLPSKLPSGEASKITARLEKLQDILPDSGRMNYKFMPPEVKKELDKISDIILKQSDMKTALSQYLQAVSHIHQITSPGYDKHTQDNAKKEIYRRAGNIILKNMTNYLIQFSSYEEQIQEKLIEAQIDSGQSPSTITDYSLNNPSEDFSSSVHMPEQKEKPSVFENLDAIEEEQIELQDYLNSEQSPESTNQYCMEWSQQYKAALSLLYDHRDFENAIKLLSAESKKSNALAYAELGKIYAHGIGIESDPENAERCYRHAFLGFSQIAESTSNGYSKYRLGKLYESGLGTQQNFDKARLYYAAAATEGKPYAEYSLGKLYLSHLQEFSKNLETDPAEILDLADKYLKSSADHGFAYGAYEYAKLHEGNPDISDSYYQTAYNGFKKMLKNKEDDTLLYRIGKMTLSGKGTFQDVKTAIGYFEKSAELNNIYAKLTLAKLYLSDEFTEFQNINKALDILTELSKENNAEAQYNLGKFYLSEQLPEYQNISKAVELLSSSSNQGNQFAQYALGKFYLSKEYQDIPKAIELLSSSADQGNQFAQYTLGKFYLSEEYQDIPKAIELLSSSSDQGNQFAQYALGKFYLSGEYQDIPKAVELLSASADQGNQFAQYALGKFYLSGEYQNIPKAVELLSASANQGNQFAQLKLGTIYLYGKYGVEKNEELGKEYLQKSASQGNTYAQETLQNYELMRSPMYFMTNLIYRAIFTSMMTSNYQKRQQLEDTKRELSKQARIEKRKQNEITHL